jgi:class 3 adenylate cyclase
MTESLPADSRAVERRYYAAMAMPFVIDTVISAIFTTVLALPDLFARNTVPSAIILLAGLHPAARWLYAPIGRYLRTGENFAGIERRLTQLPLRSAYMAALFYLPLVAYRIAGNLLGVAGIPELGWLDAVVTIIVSVIFIFVVIYFLVSAYLERLCLHLFERFGVNLGLFFGRFARKISVALEFVAIAPVALIAVDVFSYEGERLMREVMADLATAVFGLVVTLYWVARSLTRPLHRLDEAIGKVAGGDLSVRLPVTSNEEVGQVTGHFNRMVEGLRERERIRATFGKYVSKSVANALLEQSGDGRLSGETREATLLFIDIEGFTALSEGLPPDVLIAVLNDYLERVVEPIQRHGGVVSAFIGDGLFASFNLPLPNADHAASAIAAALEIQRATAEHVFAGGVRLAARIGINTGTVIGGTIGAGDRLSYTLLGDAVNAAARLQDLNKAHGTRILVSEATRRAAGERFPCRALGDVTLRGRSGAMAVFAVEG